MKFGGYHSVFFLRQESQKHEVLLRRPSILAQVFLVVRRGGFSALRDKALGVGHKLIASRRVSNWRPENTLIPSKLHHPPRRREVGVFVHVHYSEFLPRIKNILAVYTEAFPNVMFNFTSTDEKIHASLLDLATQFRNVGLVRLCVNRGRNFGPLLVSFQDEIPKVKYVIHVHTKKSPHAGKGIGDKWADLLWGNLLENLDVFRNNLSLLRAGENVSLLYPVDLKLFPPDSFSWARSRGNVPLEIAASSVNRLFDADRFPFPVGGMFMASSKGLKESLLFRRWSPEDFPKELGQTDGTVQHALERVIGCLSWSGGPPFNEQIVFFPTLGAYTTDSSFCSADLSRKNEKT